jgi:hypothetical protein
MERRFPLVWVHLGQSKVPFYLKRSMRNHAQIFSDQKLVLLVDDDKNLHNFGIRNLSVYKVHFMDEDWEIIKRRLNHDLTFRNEFWFNSLARFKALYSFLIEEKIEKLLHIESDVVLMPNFPFSSFEKIQNSLAYSLQGEGKGIASVFYVGSQSCLADFLNFCFREILQESKNTDMTLLDNFYKKNPNKTLILPTLPKQTFFEGKLNDSKIELSETVTGFGGVFDAISIGQYFFGIDPRNNRGIKKLYIEDASHWVKPSRFSFEWLENALIARQKDLKFEIFTLHIHSKNPQIFEFSSLRKQSTKSFAKSKRGPHQQIVVQEVVRSIQKAIRRRLKLNYEE